MVTRRPFAAPSLAMRKCRVASAATCGACVTQRPARIAASRFRRLPIASATAPPTPVSISSKTKVGAEPRSAMTTFNANRNRANSPPDATLISGPGREPGIGLRPEFHAVESVRPALRASSVSISRREDGALELERRELSAHGLVEFRGRFAPRIR